MIQTSPPRWGRASLYVLALLTAFCLAACGDDGGGGGGGANQTSTTELTFEGDLAAFPDFSYDSGWLPEESPVQVAVTFDVEAGLSAKADAIVGGTAADPQMSGKAGTGLYELNVKLNFQILVKIDLPGVSYEGPASDSADISFEVSGEAAFDPFALGETIDVEADIPETMIATIPLAGSIPGVEGNVILHLKGTALSAFTGDCAAVNGDTAHYTATTLTSADLILLPSIQVEIPFVYDETIDVGEVPVEVPAATLAMDLGMKSVTPGGGAVDGGGSMATVGTCDGANNGVNNGANNGVNNGANNGMGTCAETCDGCCDGETCLDGFGDGACGAAGASCETCSAGFFCGGLTCELDPESTWRIVAVSGEIFGDNMGDDWDIGGGAPDPFAIISAGYDENLEEWVYVGTTSTEDDTYIANWDEAVLIGVPAQALLDGGIAAEMIDEDIADDDEVGSCSGVVLDSAFRGELQPLCTDFGTFEVVVQFIAE